MYEMKKVFVLAFSILLFALTSNAKDEIVAVVDDDIITSGDLERKYETMIALNGLSEDQYKLPEVKGEGMIIPLPSKE